MKKEFIERVIRERVVDTRKYRYVCHFGWTHASIRRMERRVLGTTAAYDRWEVVKEYR